MRSLAAVLALSMVAMAVPASAQEDCTQASPCPWALDVGAQGFLDAEASYQWTKGDWFVLSVYNDAEGPHVVTLSGPNIRLEIPAGDIVDSQPFQVASAGDFQLKDMPSGDTIPVQVLDADVVDANGISGGDTKTTPTKDSPGVGLPLALVGIAALVALSRRR